MCPLHDRSLENKLLGGLWGSLVGDALGVPVEFEERPYLRSYPVIGMRQGGVHGQPAGTWSDDGSLLLCSVDSLVHYGFSPQDMGERFCKWYEKGLWTAHGTIFDIGTATRRALERISQGTPAGQAGNNDEYSNGNGSLMRILPVVYWASAASQDSLFLEQIYAASAITHGHVRSQMACVFYGFVIQGLMHHLKPKEALNEARGKFGTLFHDHLELGCFHELLEGDLASADESSIASSGYVLHTLKAAIWCLLTTDTFSDCVLKAVNLGDDSDTTGCVAGGLAGVCYGLDYVPEEWINGLSKRQELEALFAKFMSQLGGF